MSMDKVIRPEEHEFMSPLVDFNKFKEAALRDRRSLREAIGLAPLAEFKYPDDIPCQSPESKQMQLDEAVNDVELIAERVKQLFGLHDGDIKEMTNNMNVNHLAALNKRDIMFRRNVDQDDVPKDTKLETLKLQRLVLEGYKPLKKLSITFGLSESSKQAILKQRSALHQNMNYAISKMKYGDYLESEVKHRRLNGPQTSDCSDIVVTVVLGKPYNKPLDGVERRNATFQPQWRFLLRGENTLADLHSLFRCSSDHGASVDHNVVPKLHDLFMFKYPSSFLFIHDTFYVATKYMFSGETFSQLNGIQLENLKDISAPIREWMSRKKNDFGPTFVKSLSEKPWKIKDMVCRLGYPYVYLHQGSCEHVFFFTDLRLMDAQDFPIGYPRKLADNSVENLCVACGGEIADWIVESESLPLTPAHMCDDCYNNFHYAVRYQCTPDTKAFWYTDPGVLHA